MSSPRTARLDIGILGGIIGAAGPLTRQVRGLESMYFLTKVSCCSGDVKATNFGDTSKFGFDARCPSHDDLVYAHRCIHCLKFSLHDQVVQL